MQAIEGMNRRRTLLSAGWIASFLAVIALTSCTRFGSPQMLRAARFNEAITVTCKLGPLPLPQRIAKAKALLLRLDSYEDIVATALFEDGRVVVTATLGGTDKWRVDFHLVWPEPQLNNQHLSVFKLVNWSAAAPSNTVANESSALNARSRAEKRLREAILALTTDGGPLEGGVTLIEETEG